LRLKRTKQKKKPGWTFKKLKKPRPFSSRYNEFKEFECQPLIYLNLSEQPDVGASSWHTLFWRVHFWCTPPERYLLLIENSWKALCFLFTGVKCSRDYETSIAREYL
jgi:hypothetical protein